MIERLVNAEMKQKVVVMAIIVIIVALFFSLALRLQLDTNLSSMIPDDGEFNENNELLRKAFNQADGLLILIKKDNHAYNYICECGDASPLFPQIQGRRARIDH